VFLAGFSLGGNFALRIAGKEKADPIRNLKSIVSISPVLDPDKATDRIDENPFLLSYFIRKWKKSLHHKQHLFPEYYRFNEILMQKTIRRMTEMLIDRYSDYPDTKTYFKGYGIFGNDLKDTRVPTTIITATDDPVIPVADFYDLKLPAWYDRYILNVFKKES